MIGGIGLLIHFLFVILVVGFLLWLALWAMGELPMPQPFAKVARVLCIVIAFLVVLYEAMPMLGAGHIF